MCLLLSKGLSYILFLLELFNYSASEDAGGHLDDISSNYVFTVIIPVYNTEAYISMALDSVINQTLGFHTLTEVIIINDGSTDNSREVCLLYQRAFPQNIIVYDISHSGASYARAFGLQHARGRFITFLDSDDYWGLDCFASVKRFFDVHDGEVDLVACRIKMFEGRTDYHTLDFKFDRSGVVDLLKEPSKVQLHLASTFIRRSCIGNLSFSPNLTYGEDAQFLCSLLLKHPSIGYLREAVYYYRKRETQQSLIQNEFTTDSYFTDSVTYFHKNVFNQSIKRYGTIVAFVQYTVMYDIQWRVQHDVSGYINTSMLETYRADILSIIKQIDDSIILSQKQLNIELRVFCMSLKYGYDIRKDFSIADNRLVYEKRKIVRLTQWNCRAHLLFLELQNNTLIIEGRQPVLLSKDRFPLEAEIDGKILHPVYALEPSLCTRTLFGRTQYGYTFKFVIELGVMSAHFIQLFLHDGTVRKVLPITYGKFSKLQHYNGSYYVTRQFIMRENASTLTIQPYTKREHCKLEWNLLIKLFKMKLYTVVFYRIAYHLSPISKRPIWLLFDRINRADDNGKALFLYLRKRRVKDTTLFFCLRKNSTDYQRMKHFGKVLDFDSIRYKITFLHTEKIISSHADEFFFNPFGKNRLYLEDLFNYDYIFLQHGVTQHDVSGWLNRFSKNLKGFLTTSHIEYQSILDSHYSYTPNVVKLTGFPRHDMLLELESQIPTNKYIVIAPTWRQNLTPKRRSITDEHMVCPNFKQSNFYSFYHSLINDDRLRSTLRQQGYTGEFVLHPTFAIHWKDFVSNSEIRVHEGFIDYQNMFAKAALLITDYSSVAFDFAYLKKPVIYTQFDRDAFLHNHFLRKGYFNFTDHGFGPICEDIDSTINTIIYYINRDCRMEELYLRRVDSFFAYSDKSNSERVYRSIRSLRHASADRPCSNLFLNPLKLIIYILLFLQMLRLSHFSRSTWIGSHPKKYK